MNYYKTTLREFIKDALKEDVGTNDITTNLVIKSDRFIRAEIIAKENCIVCGINIAGEVFRSIDKAVKYIASVKDGQRVKKGERLAYIIGKPKSILAAERVALNFLSLLSAISTKTKKYVNAAKPSKVKILDTRKTIPGLRLLAKYAVRIAGGYNHRLCLDEMVMIKDNHLKIIGGIEKLNNLKSRYKTEIEVGNLNDFKRAITFKPDIIMLDNMKLKDIKRAVEIRNSLPQKSLLKKPLLEVSGGITLKKLKKISRLGIDMISVGALTHSIESVDLSLEIL